jgi:hypothetical protein
VETTVLELVHYFGRWHGLQPEPRLPRRSLILEAVNLSAPVNLNLGTYFDRRFADFFFPLQYAPAIEVSL